MFLRSVMVVNGIEHAATPGRGRAEQDGRAATVGADLHRYPTGQVPHSRVEESFTFISRHESDDRLGEGEQSRSIGGNVVIGFGHAMNLT